MEIKLSINKGTIFFALLLAIFVGSIGFAYSDEIVSAFVTAPQQCSAGKCVYGFDESGGILCRPCSQISLFRNCIWDGNTTETFYKKEYNLQYDGCKKGEEYAHGETCIIGITNTDETCWFNGKWVKWKRATCRDSLWSIGTERYCRRNQ